MQRALAGNSGFQDRVDFRLGCLIGAPVFAQILGSLFNIWYNFTYVQPLLSPAELEAFWWIVKLFNATVYPLGVGVWVVIVLSLRRPCLQIQQQISIAPDRLQRAQQRVIHLPWWGMAIAAALWLLCIPVFLAALSAAPGRLNPRLLSDLPISFIIAGLIAITHGFFTIELISQRLFYPILFQHTRPTDVPHTLPLSLRGRTILTAVGGGICPIISLLLVMVAHSQNARDAWFAIAVGTVSIGFSLTTAWMGGKLVVEPIRALQRTAVAIASGDFNARVRLLRADEFGLLIAEFNQMALELQEKQVLQESFGRHVGQQVALKILRQDPDLSGTEQELTVLFADLRNFTQRCSSVPPQTIVALLNIFLSEMVEIVEQQHGGMVNKFLGDGFMALFGVGPEEQDHATRAVQAGCIMLQRLDQINRQLIVQTQDPLAMGIGIHTGRAVVGSIGSSRRLEYTAIGDTVNIAARVEALTKQVGTPLLFTESTRQALPLSLAIAPLPPQSIKGKADPLHIYTLPSAVSAENTGSP